MTTADLFSDSPADLVFEGPKLLELADWVASIRPLFNGAAGSLGLEPARLADGMAAVVRSAKRVILRAPQSAPIDAPGLFGKAMGRDWFYEF